MRALRADGAGGVRVVDVDAPDGEVVVQVAAVGICGSDLKLVATGFVPPTITLGHEVAGVLADGTPVAIEPIVRCGTCDQCVAGDYHRCRTGAVLGGAVDGGLADAVAVPASCVVPLPSGVGVRDACLVEPLAVAVHGLRLAGVVDGMRVAVVGAGAIGLAAVAAALHAGASAVDVVARHAPQAAAVEALGARPAVDGEYDVVVEAAGTASSIERSVQLAAPGGVVSVLGSSWGPMTVDGVAIQMKELRLLPAITYNAAPDGTRDVDVAAALLAARPEVADVLVSHRFGLDDGPQAFATAADRSSGAIKVVIEP